MLKAQKALEPKVHETLYTNIYMLTQIYKPGNGFWGVFKKDMFVKNNKSACQEIIYYLLSVLNPSITKEKVPSWPCLDTQYERQFRTEVMKYLNELNDLYDNANMPTIMASQLISPGGMKFAKYMLKLSILVLYEHLQRTSENADTILLKPSIRKNKNDAEKQIKGLNNLRIAVDKENKELLSDYNCKHLDSIYEADAILDELDYLQLNIPLLEEKLRSLQSEKSESNGSLNEIFLEKIEALKQSVSKIRNISDKITKIKDAIMYLSKKDLALEHTSESPNNEKLDLIGLFKQFNIEMEQYCLQMTSLTDEELNHYIAKFSSCNQALFKLINELIDVQQKSYKVLVDLQSGRMKTETLSSGDSTALAVPLGDTTSE